ncbi:MAG TPA: hypothetical protein PLV92_07750, partial [Pirellulaceae bacterium]|nr:hypothetical protein [Pirellulaceae bacterium]
MSQRSNHGGPREGRSSRLVEESRIAQARRTPLSRRAMLKAAGVAFSLPLLDAMRPVFAGDREPETPRRLVAIE